MASPLTTIPNVGPAVARTLERLDIAVPDDLRGRDPHELFDRLCDLDGRDHDPCLLDTFVAAVSYVEGGPARPWWEFSRERKARARGLTERSLSRQAYDRAGGNVMQVWIDQDCCTGAGLCVDHCPDLFIVLDDGIGYVHDGGLVITDAGHPAMAVPRRHERAAIDAAERCPGECIYLELDSPRPAADDGADIVDADLVDPSATDGSLGHGSEA